MREGEGSGALRPPRHTKNRQPSLSSTGICLLVGSSMDPEVGVHSGVALSRLSLYFPPGFHMLSPDSLSPGVHGPRSVFPHSRPSRLSGHRRKVRWGPEAGRQLPSY